jgi:cytidine deaminase
LERAAHDAAQFAYAPYSRYAVGAAATVVGSGADGAEPRIVSGANVENASYGLTLCAECSLVSALHMAGGGRLGQFVCVARALGGAEAEPARITMPCGRCRQLLWEHGGPELRIMTPKGERLLAEVLPQAWGPADLAGAGGGDQAEPC